MGILVFGSVNVDHVMRVERISRPGETNMAADQQIFFGGKGANQAVAAARASTECSVAMAGAIGADGLGDDVLANFAQNAVDTALISRVDVGTGTAYIFIDPDGENAITVVSGANAKVDATDIGDVVLKQATHLLFQMEVPLDENVELASRYKTMNPDGTVIVNLAPAPSPEMKKPLALLLGQTDILLVNEHELVRTSEILSIPAVGDMQDAAAQLVNSINTTVVVTLGNKGAIAVLKDGGAISIAPTPIVPVDTTGAGDTFAGVMASGLAEGRDLRSALQRASLAGALACLKIGAQAAMPYSTDLDSHALSSDSCKTNI